MDLFNRDAIYDAIIRARTCAFKEGIRANSIVINENMVKVQPFPMDVFKGYVMTSPMICGLNVYWTKDELPDGYSFALFEDQRPNRLAEFESIGMEPHEVRKAAEIYRAIKDKMED